MYIKAHGHYAMTESSNAITLALLKGTCKHLILRHLSATHTGTSKIYMFFCAHKHQWTDSCKAMYYKGLDALKCLIIQEHSS